ncbi:DUF1553 domain-containing protein [Stieleria sp. TO1_6]|uniref:PSD1 and planctomycete cytochrome C domain-containing protein n=1 Tax=Stieleria tagensis TaxID=2956795 RepID=UPI00209B08A4|nr:DUF1553 domain-containing protein [Stieleria tagensis]MCO8124472.1 DUF1553 domain-containing protein [Stieleria tagensis]
MRHSFHLAAVAALSLGHLMCARTVAQDIDYLTEIKPLLSEKCYACHGVLKQESDLRVETLALMLENDVVTPGDPDASLLLQRITAEGDQRMPPPDEGSALQPDQIELVRRWILQGAVAPEEAPPPAPREHWSFQPIVRPDVDDIGGDTLAEHPIDQLLARQRDAQGIQPLGRASRPIALRRLYLDLVGLPPTRNQLQDERPWHEIVDALLASPHHGERWARHWMDVWRYSEGYGLGQQLRFSQPHMWHWRDWIIQSLNDDKPYDRMIQEMLAGDELAPGDPQAISATGFLARNYYLFNRTTWLDSTIEHTGKAFLGLTLNCAKCHDHKYDPITHLDYYRYRAIFEPHQVRLDPVPGVIDFEQDGIPRVFDDHVDQPTYLHRRGDPNDPDTDHQLTAGVPEIFSEFEPLTKPVSLPPSAYAPGTRDYSQRDQIAAAKRKVSDAFKNLRQAEQDHDQALQNAKQPSPSYAMIDTFDAANPDRWKMVGDGWQYQDGKLSQTVATTDPPFVRLLDPLPHDFQVECWYTTTGGAKYRSVTFRFDQSENLDEANFVYTSAQSPGSKVQAAITRGGKSSYPGEGRAAQSIEIGNPIHLRFALRGTLCNVWLNDEFVLAYQFPDRPIGGFSFGGFDASVAFDKIAIESLADDVELTAAKNKPGTADSTTESAVKLARLKLDAAQRRLAATESTIRADNAQFQSSHGDASAMSLAFQAARSQADAEIAEANYQLAAATSDKARQTAEQQRQAATNQREQIDPDQPVYQSLRGAQKALESPADKESDYPPTYTPTSTGRRLALAQWITSTENPLTARVAVNQVWMRHFGTPLVESVFDFGLRAKQPLQHELLDFLAAEFMASGWSFKHLHRLIVTSDAYRRTSSQADANAATLAADPTNQFYWRGNSHRMESQLVRDTLLLHAGQLDATIGGPSVDPNQSSRRRSLYLKHSRDQQDKFLSMFDDADIMQCYRRSESIVPQQALALSNSEVAIEMSDQIARRITRERQSSRFESFVQACFAELLGRDVTATELAECEQFWLTMNQLDEVKSLVPDAREHRIRSRLVQAMINHNDFVTIR